MNQKFYDYQKQRFGWLLWWGAANTVIGGLLGLLGRDKFWRGLQSMNFGYGFVNALLALAGRRGAAQNAARFPNDAARTRQEAVKMRRLLLINAPLDVLYVLSGLWLIRQKQDNRRGWGIGLIIQGVWLFFYDSLLAREVGNRYLVNQDSQKA